MQNYTFTFTEQEANVILNALGQRPYVEVAGLIGKIQQQAAETIEKSAEAEKSDTATATEEAEEKKEAE